MRISLTICLVLGLAIFAQAGGWSTIQADYEKGAISANQRVEFAITLLTNPDQLPLDYKIDQPIKDATGMVVDILAEKDNIDPDLFNRFSMLLARQTKQKRYDTPQGHFRIQYDTSGTHAVYQPTVDVNPADGVPDYVNRTGEYFERAWTYECDSLGYDTPPSDGSAGGGSGLYDVYMHSYSGAYGVTWPESPSSERPGRNNDYTSYIFVDPTYTGFGYTDRTLPMKVTSAHEFFHAVQFAYNSSAGSWFMENCATWMEDVLWDDIDDNHFYLPSFMNNPHLTLATANGGFEYGAFVWPTYLSERYGNELIRNIWIYTIGQAALGAVIAGLDDYALGIGVAYPEFATWNFITGNRNDGQHYSEAAGYNQVRIMRTHTSYPVTNNTSSYPPSLLGCNYVMFVRGQNTGNLHITFNGNDAGTWAVRVVKSLTLNTHEFDTLALNAQDDGEIVIPHFENYRAVTIIPCVLGGNNQNFSYSAHVDTVTGIEEQQKNLPGQFALIGNYPNPFNGGTVISFAAPAGYNGTTSLDIFDQLGRKIRSIPVSLTEGLNKITLGRTEFGDLSSGMYFYRISAGGQAFTGKMTYLK
jgi:hypothetical protein